MSYCVSHARLTYRKTGGDATFGFLTATEPTESSGLTAFIDTHEQLTEYISDYRNKNLKSAVAILSPDLGKEYSEWQKDFTNRQVKITGKNARNVVTAIGKAFMGNIEGLANAAKGIYGHYKNMADVSNNEPHDFLFLDYHFNEIYEFKLHDVAPYADPTRVGLFLRR